MFVASFVRFKPRRHWPWILCLLLTLQSLSVITPDVASGTSLVTVTVDTSKPVNRFIPSHAIGAGVDGQEFGSIKRQLSPENIRAMLTAGLKPLAYRLRTELAGEAWHWNPRGRWSDGVRRQGYWTSSTELNAPIKVSYGYRLPRRGNTIDQANDDGYSRIADGDPRSFWKSNPYLDEHFTHEQNSHHPQWVLIDLGESKGIDAIRIEWGRPFATKFAIQYGDFVGDEDLSQRLPTDWHSFPHGDIENGKGGNSLLRLANQSLRVRYVRVRLDESSERAAQRSHDVRDRLGFAIREIYLGTITAHGRFQDAIRHAASHDTQTHIYVSSTDPWHRAVDRDKDTEQPGFDFIFDSGLTNGLPVMLPVPVLYDTPANAVAEIEYLTMRGYPMDRVEVGEEPDGQFIDSEHYAQLYVQFVEALRRANPRLHFGGPSMQDIEQTEVPGRIEFGKGGWLGRFLQYLKAHGRMKDFSFFSFEWYPFEDDCERPGEQLQSASTMLSDALDELQQGGLTHEIPWIISEYGYSAFAARAEIDLEGALLNADSVARFLTLGGGAAYLYGYEASEVIKENDCSAGNNMLFFLDTAGGRAQPTATYWGGRLLTQEWVKPGDELHEIYPAMSDLKNAQGEEVVTAYALRRPDGLWSIMLINKDPKESHQVQIILQNKSGTNIWSPVEMVQFSGAQYQLASDRERPVPLKSDPPARFRMERTAPLTLPNWSITVVRGKL